MPVEPKEEHSFIIQDTPTASSIKEEVVTEKEAPSRIKGYTTERIRIILSGKYQNILQVAKLNEMTIKQNSLDDVFAVRTLYGGDPYRKTLFWKNKSQQGGSYLSCTRFENLINLFCWKSEDSGPDKFLTPKEKIDLENNLLIPLWKVAFGGKELVHKFPGMDAKFISKDSFTNLLYLSRKFFAIDGVYSGLIVNTQDIKLTRIEDKLEV